MSSTATINLSSSPKTAQIFQVGTNQSSPKSQVFHISGNNPPEPYQPLQMNIQGHKLAYPASSYPSDDQQQQQLQQYQMQQLYQPNQQSSQPQYFQSQEEQYQRQPQYYQAQYQPQEQYHQQYQSLPPPHHHSIEMAKTHPHMTINKGPVSPTVFEAPMEKIQIVKKNAPLFPKVPPVNMQQSFRSSRSGSFVALEEITDPPNFIKHPEPRQVTLEGEPITLSARVTPAGDPNLMVQWYKDGNPLSAGSRFNTSFERGFAILDILYTIKEDCGEYSCVARNNFGMDQTSPSILKVTVEDNVVLNSHLPQEMADNIAAIEASRNIQRDHDMHSEAPVRPPQFIKPLPSIVNLQGSQSVHLETRIMPIDDSNMIIEWFKNGKPLDNGCRFNIIFDRGFAILDINGVISEDSGEYFCYARNAAGQSQSNIVRVFVAEEETVVTKSQLPKESVQYLQSLDAQTVDDVDRSSFRYVEEEEAESLPHFDIKPVDVCIEDGSPAKFLVKVNGYPRPWVQWFVNEEIIVPSSTLKICNDGSICYVEFQKCRLIGNNHITVLAKNKLGEAVSNATLTVVPENNYRPELRQTDIENPFRKLATLKKVDVSPELQNAFRRQKSGSVQLNNFERRSSKSRETADAEQLYANVQSRLRRSDNLSYAGAPTGGQKPLPNEQYSEPSTKSSQFSMQIGGPVAR